MRRINLFLNISLILFAAILGVLIVKHYYTRAKPAPLNHTELRVGSQVQLGDVDWEKNGQTLVLALSKNCHYCFESAEFYRRLANEKANKPGIHLMAVFPEAADKARQYLNDLHIDITDVRQASLLSLGVKGIPTAMVVDRSGTVTAIWRGKLSAEEENQVTKASGLAEPSNQVSKASAADKRISTDELRRLTERAKVLVLDVRDRDAYAREHIPGAKNIAVDELEVRAVNELSRTDLIVIYCRCADAASSEIARDILAKQGFRKLAILSE